MGQDHEMSMERSRKRMMTGLQKSQKMENQKGTKVTSAWRTSILDKIQDMVLQEEEEDEKETTLHGDLISSLISMMLRKR